MAYNSEAILQLRVIAQGLDALTTWLSQIDRDGTVAQKVLDGLERSTARLSKTARDAADTAEATAKGFDAEGRAAAGAAAGVDKVAASNERAAASQKTLGQSLSTTRTSLYDASRSLATFGAATLALPVASAFVAAAYQRDFATVERSLVGSKYNAAALKQSFVDLSEQIPLSFKQITSIAGAGAQLGIDASGLTSFTKVVAELTATTNLTADAAENFLGKFHAIGAVPTSDFGRLASAVLDVGVHTAATEQQIATAATGIVGIGKEAGFTTPQIIGLAGALTSVSSSIRNPQLIRGTMTRFVNDMANAVRTGGPALETYAKTAGISTDAVRAAFGTDKFAGTFQKFVDGLDKVQKSGGDTIGVLNQMGIHSVQDIPLLLNLASGHNTLATAIARANEGWNEQYLLQQHFDKINDTLVSKTKELGNAFGALFNDMGKASTGPLMAVVDGLNGIVRATDGFIKSPVGQWVSGLTLGLLTFVGVGALAFALLSKMAAGGIAVSQAWKGITTWIDAHRAAQIADNIAVAASTSESDAAVAAIAARTAATAENTTATEVNAAATASSSKQILGALGSIGKVAALAGLAIGGAFLAGSLTSELDKNTIAAHGYNTDTVKGNVSLLTQPKANDFKTGALQSAITPTLKNSPDIGTRRFGVNVFGGAFDPSGQAIKNFDEKLAGLAAKGPTEFATIGSAITAMGQKTGLTFNEMKAAFPSLTGELDKLGFKVKETSKGYEVYTTAASSAADKNKALAASFQSISGMSDKDAKSMGQDYAKSVASLTDFNTVIGSVQKSLQTQADTEAKIKGGKASDYYDGVTVSVQQFTDAMAANNTQQQTWFGNLGTLKTQVLSQTGDAGTAAQITNQLLQAGYSVTNASFLQQLVDAAPDQRAKYIQTMQDSMNATAAAAGQALIDAGSLTGPGGAKPDAATVGKMLLAGFSPADIMAALNLQFADPNNAAKPKADTKDANKKLDDLVTKYGGMAITFDTNVNTGPAQNHIDTFITDNNGKHLNIIVNYQGVNQGYVPPGGKNSPSGATGGYFTGSGFHYSNGGAVFGAGTGTSDSVPAWLSNGEFVIKAASVRSLGIDYLQMLNKYGSTMHRASGGPVSRGFSPTGHYASGGPVQASNGAALSTISYLSPFDRQLLIDIRDNIGVNLDGRVLASSSNAHNADAAVRVRN